MKYTRVKSLSGDDDAIGSMIVGEQYIGRGRPWGWADAMIIVIDAQGEDGRGVVSKSM